MVEDEGTEYIADDGAYGRRERLYGSSSDSLFFSIVERFESIFNIGKHGVEFCSGLERREKIADSDIEIAQARCNGFGKDGTG